MAEGANTSMEMPQQPTWAKALLEVAESAAREARDVQRRATRFWTLEVLRRDAELDERLCNVRVTEKSAVSNRECSEDLKTLLDEAQSLRNATGCGWIRGRAERRTYLGTVLWNRTAAVAGLCERGDLGKTECDVLAKASETVFGLDVLVHCFGLKVFVPLPLQSIDEFYQSTTCGMAPGSLVRIRFDGTVEPERGSVGMASIAMLIRPASVDEQSETECRLLKQIEDPERKARLLERCKERAVQHLQTQNRAYNW